MGFGCGFAAPRFLRLFAAECFAPSEPVRRTPAPYLCRRLCRCLCLKTANPTKLTTKQRMRPRVHLGEFFGQALCAVGWPGPFHRPSRGQKGAVLRAAQSALQSRQHRLHVAAQQCRGVEPKARENAALEQPVARCGELLIISLPELPPFD